MLDVRSKRLCQCDAVPALSWWWCRREFRGRGDCLLLSDETVGLWCVGEQCGVNKEVFDKAQVFTLEQAIESAARIGYPVMLKASEGGGGKGIRMNANEEELRSNFVQVCCMSGVLTKARLSPVCVAGASIALSQSRIFITPSPWIDHHQSREHCRLS